MRNNHVDDAVAGVNASAESIVDAIISKVVWANTSYNIKFAEAPLEVTNSHRLWLAPKNPHYPNVGRDYFEAKNHLDAINKTLAQLSATSENVTVEELEAALAE